MTPAILAAIAEIAPYLVKWGEASYQIIASAIRDAGHPVTDDEIRAAVAFFGALDSLAAAEAEAGVTPNPDGSVSPKP